MRSKEDLKRVHPKHFPSNLSEAEQIEWLRIAKPNALEIARQACTEFHGSEVHARVIAEIDRKTRDTAEDTRHREEMDASAHANRRANQALSVGLGSLVLALIAILQQCRG